MKPETYSRITSVTLGGAIASAVAAQYMPQYRSAAFVVGAVSAALSIGCYVLQHGADGTWTESRKAFLRRKPSAPPRPDLDLTHLYHRSLMVRGLPKELANRIPAAFFTLPFEHYAQQTQIKWTTLIGNSALAQRVFLEVESRDSALWAAQHEMACATVAKRLLLIDSKHDAQSLPVSIRSAWTTAELAETAENAIRLLEERGVAARYVFAFDKNGFTIRARPVRSYRAVRTVGVQGSANSQVEGRETTAAIAKNE